MVLEAREGQSFLAVVSLLDTDGWSSSPDRACSVRMWFGPFDLNNLASLDILYRNGMSQKTDGANARCIALSALRPLDK